MVSSIRNHLQADWLLFIGGFPEERQADTLSVYLAVGNAQCVKTKAVPFTLHPALRKIYIAKQALNLARLTMMGT
jgi:Zn finger protein HypA/HybF involved in hydrogenase expression